MLRGALCHVEQLRAEIVHILPCQHFSLLPLGSALAALSWPRNPAGNFYLPALSKPSTAGTGSAGLLRFRHVGRSGDRAIPATRHAIRPTAFRKIDVALLALLRLRSGYFTAEEILGAS